jgi:hypothetical protein
LPGAVTSCAPDAKTYRDDPRSSKATFDGAEETWVHRVIADGIAS